MKLSVVIPALNEEATIGQVISKIPKEVPGISQVVVVVVDDGSTDNTANIARGQGAIVVSHPRNIGVGSAFQTGVKKSLDLGVDLMLNMDADGQFDPTDIPKLIAPILEGKAECTTASRFINPELYPQMSTVKFYGNKVMALLISALVGRRFYDVSCGFRAYSRHALLNLNLVGEYTYTQETFLNFQFKGINIVEVPLKIRGEREFGNSRVAASVWVYAYRSLNIIARAFRDYKPLRVFSGIALFMVLIAVCLASFVLYHYLQTGSIFPHKWAGLTAGFFAMMGFLTFTTALLADMLDRIRINQERVLYHLMELKHSKRGKHDD